MPDQGTVVVPPAMRDAARDCELGGRRGIVHTEPRRLVWAALTPLLVVGLLILWFGVRFAVEDQRTSGAWYFSLPILVLGMAPLALAGWLVVRAWTQPRIWVGHYERGLVRWVTGKVPEVYEWDEIAGITRAETHVTNGLTSAAQRTLTVFPAGAEPIVVSDSCDGFAGFADDVDAAFTRVRLPQDAARLETGERVGFLLVDLDHTGIGHLDLRLDWQRVERVEVRNGILIIRQVGVRKPWLSIPSHPVWNVRVFLALAEALRRQHGPR
ncbi:DUF6585 family protein [Streptomyces sp. NPDC094049]|uniref:DUF6585 family protein n=1 Tax=Streptomyces sp. NPDC094049 TaxID=3154987 RepID=UPI003319C552